MEVNPANRREKIISLTETGKQYARELVLPLFQSDRKSTRLNSSHPPESRMPSSA